MYIYSPKQSLTQKNLAAKQNKEINKSKFIAAAAVTLETRKLSPLKAPNHARYASNHMCYFWLTAM